MTRVSEAEPDGRSLSRRRFLTAGATTAVGAASLAIPVVVANSAIADETAEPTARHVFGQAQPAATPTSGTQTQPLGGFVYFNTFQAEIVNAASGRILPTDDNGPGAIEAGVVYFIDRQLSASYGLTGRRYEQGPYAAGQSTQGDQSGLDMRDRYRVGIQGMEDYAQQLYQQGFASLTPDQQDQILHDMQAGIPSTFDGASIQAATTQAAGSGTEAAIARMAPGAPGVGAAAFFQLLLSHVIAGFFADPVYGGNRDMVGWKLIGFPGAQMSYAGWITRYGVPFDGPFMSLADHQRQFALGG